MTATLRVLQKRLKSVMSIQKITKSMRMVSAAKYARAERVLKDAKGFGIGSLKFYNSFPVDQNTLNEVGIIAVAITSDRGLCGAVHSNVCKRIIRQLKAMTEKTSLVCVGDKSRAILRFQFNQKIRLAINNVGRNPPTFLDASKIVIILSEMGLVDKIWFVVYNRYMSIIKYNTEELFIANKQLILDSDNLNKYEHSDESMTDYVDFSKASLIFYSMCESSCSEQSSRMTAMDNASKNASEMIASLSIKYNRNRQALITKELIEIISGASALQSKD